MSYPLDIPLEEYTDEELRKLLKRVRGSRLVAKMTSPARKESRKKETSAKNKAKKLMENLTPEQIAALVAQLGGE